MTDLDAYFEADMTVPVPGIPEAEEIYRAVVRKSRMEPHDRKAYRLSEGLLGTLAGALLYVLGIGVFPRPGQWFLLFAGMVCVEICVIYSVRSEVDLR